MKNGLNLYFVAHLNLSYSSIPEEEHPAVIRDCYWPLVRVVEKYGLPVGIELSGSTLERINEIDCGWVEALKNMCRGGGCEILASGYSQIIGPLVPKRVNEKNIETGLQIYEELLGVRPRIVYVNEQALSGGVVDVYIDADFDAMFMEWNNPYSSNKDDWDVEWQYYPQYAISATGRKLATVWNNAISFQKLQRYIHGKITLDAYLEYLESHTGANERYFCMYGNDVEIFDYRPGRFSTEPMMHEDGEWSRMDTLFDRLTSSEGFLFATPGGVLRCKENKSAFNSLALCTSAVPLPVKKQNKYNITRWALTGRDDVRNNGRCYELYNTLKTIEEMDGTDGLDPCWKELCRLWESDFRTHITDEKYASFLRLQGVVEYILRIFLDGGSGGDFRPKRYVDSMPPIDGDHLDSDQDGMVKIAASKVDIVLDCRRGMAIDSLTFKDIGGDPVIGALHHGFFHDISWGADFYSGHTIIQPINNVKITSLEPVTVFAKAAGGDTARVFSSSVKTPSGVIYETLRVYNEASKVEIEYVFGLNGLSGASFHTGIMTFLPDAFDEESLYYATHNGGDEEKFSLKGCDFDHTQPVPQSIISAVHCLGATEGVVKIGDKDKVITIRSEKYPISAQPMIEFRKVDDKFLLRLYYSLGEYDETSHWMWKGRARWKMSIEASAQGLCED